MDVPLHSRTLNFVCKSEKCVMTGRRFCREACKANFLAKTARDYACWLGVLPRGAA
jgi:hypothetical protein